MSDYLVYYNPLAGANDGGKTVKDEIGKLLDGENVTFIDLTSTADLQDSINGAGKKDKIIIAGGDGTLNKFINLVNCDKIKQEVYLYPSGNGNDFYTDITRSESSPATPAESPEKLVKINEYLTGLPEVTVNGKTYKFINGVGYGIDGYCCEVGDRLKAEGKSVNYTSIAVKGLLFKFKPRGATVTVDGKTYNFPKVWIAPAMNGRFYGGGMIPTPEQRRNSGTLSLCMMYGKGKLKTLMTFPKIFKGEHVQKKCVKILCGKQITVKFNKPCALQIDGETILNVSEYTAKTY